ncbi:hypothetical protein [Fischerella sp. JS2]|uniref:hypothetical protein n=1 Tax=Fischerella sp. JS2 TaxID=2597771 RepID=UPI0028E2648A|nr:hypothetical protein [Fischerella sp. JS2]
MIKVLPRLIFEPVKAKRDNQLISVVARVMRESTKLGYSLQSQQCAIAHKGVQISANYL